MALPKIIAHRGANDTEPEHSLAAYIRAIKFGVDAVECDVRLTNDGTLVCLHDRRIDRTSSGGGRFQGNYSPTWSPMISAGALITGWTSRIRDPMKAEPG